MVSESWGLFCSYPTTLNELLGPEGQHCFVLKKKKKKMIW